MVKDAREFPAVTCSRRKRNTKLLRRILHLSSNDPETEIMTIQLARKKSRVPQSIRASGNTLLERQHPESNHRFTPCTHLVPRGKIEGIQHGETTLT